MNDKQNLICIISYRSDPLRSPLFGLSTEMHLTHYIRTLLLKQQQQQQQQAL